MSLLMSMLIQCIMLPTNEFINVNADTMHNAAYK